MPIGLQAVGMTVGGGNQEAQPQKMRNDGQRSHGGRNDQLRGETLCQCGFSQVWARSSN
jgi:hypothetical protein